MGDAVDNIPGVRGIGEQTAIACFSDFDRLENLLSGLDEVATLTLRCVSRVRKILEDHHDAELPRHDLATVRRDVPLAIGFAELEWIGFNQEICAARLPSWNSRIWLRCSITSGCAR